MNKALFNKTKVMIEAPRFRDLYDAVMRTLTGDFASDDWGNVEIEVNGVTKYNVIPTHWRFKDDEWYTITIVRHKDGKAFNIRTVGSGEFGRNMV